MENKYFTVEYETMDGSKAIIHGFIPNPGNGEWAIMRPWRNQKSEGIAEGCSNIELRRIKSECEWQDKPDECEGWIKWDGGKMPNLPHFDIVEGRHRNGDVQKYTVRSLSCKHTGEDYDITAYRIVKEPSPEVKVKKQTLLEFAIFTRVDIDIMTPTEILEMVSDYLESEARVGSSSKEE